MYLYTRYYVVNAEESITREKHREKDHAKVNNNLRGKGERTPLSSAATAMICPREKAFVGYGYYISTISRFVINF